MESRQFDDFNDFAQDYRKEHTNNIKISGADSFYFAELKVKWIGQFENGKTIKMLDVGCGDGTTEIFMNQYFPFWELKGIDISSKSIENALIKKIGQTDFLGYDGKNIPFPDAYFDVVFMAGVLHHVNFQEHVDLIKEIKRVLKKGGRFYLFEHNPFNPITKYLVKTCVFDKNAKLLKNSYSKKLLLKNDFTILTNQYIIFFPIKWFFKKLSFLEKYLWFIPFGGQYFIRAIKTS